MASGNGNPPVETVSRRHPLLRRLAKNRLALAAICLLVVVHTAAVFAPALSTHSPEEISLTNRFAKPNPTNWLGTDENGRDIYSRLLHGGRVTLAVGAGAMLIAITLGVTLGATAGFFGGWADSIIMRITDGLLSVPMFFFLLLVLAVFGPSTANVVGAIGLTSWMMTARVVRGEVLKVKTMLYIEAARAVGTRDLRIVTRHVLPQAIPSIIVSATLCIAYGILNETALSYLGLGIQPPVPTWGNMLMGAQNYVWNAPLIPVFPGVCVFLTVLAYNFLGDGLRDALDPTQVH